MRRRAAKRTAVHPTERLELVEGMRGVAALYVVLSHFVNIVDPRLLEGKSTSPIWLQKLMMPFTYGHLAVAAFIVLSGFCLQLSLFNGKDGRIHDLKRFLQRRAWRILPAYYASLALSIGVCIWVTQYQTGLPYSQYVPVTRENVLAHVFMVHNLSPEWMYKINGVLWSIALEIQLYLMFPLFVILLFRFGRVGIVGIGSLFAFLTLAFLPVATKLYPWFVPLFCLGMATAHFAYRPNLRVGIQPRLASVCFWFSLVGIGLTVGMKSLIPSDLFIGLSVSCLIYLGAVAPWLRLPGTFGWKPLIKLGAFSYSLYLMHHPILQVLFVNKPAWAKGDGLEMVFCLAVALPLILLGTWLFSLAFERPFIAKKAGSRQTDRADDYTPVGLPLRTLGATPTYAAVMMEDSELTPART
ncbi:MAG: acyltransferase [Chlorobia bacterium]|nr:acyltransferase [Fimbriimonadaceae bacterium]